MLTGKCAVVGRALFDKTINVQIVYFASDTVKPKNTINTVRLQTLLNSNSINQSFVRFSVLHNIISIKDSLNATANTEPGKAYNAILKRCAKERMIFTTTQPPVTVYVVMTELQFAKSDNNGIIEEKGGGVIDNSNLAIMWLIGNTSEDKEKLIIHEIGHTLGLKDVFADDKLGKPSSGFSRHNYMDYNVKRKMFFKTQIQTIINNLTPPKK
jgi:predicted Zn-dependent protease